MRIEHDTALALLPEDFGEADARQYAGAQNILEHRARPYGWKLVDITDQDHMAALRYRGKEMLHEYDVHHGHLIEDNDIGLQLLIRVLGKHGAARLIAAALCLQQAMDGECPSARRFR